jgi:uncharacterized protein YvpB
MIATHACPTRKIRWIDGFWILLLLLLSACQSEPTLTPAPTLSPTPSKPVGSATPFVTPTITPLPSFTLEPILNFSAPDEQFDAPADQTDLFPTADNRASRSLPAATIPPPLTARTVTPRPTNTSAGPTEERSYPVSYTISDITGHQQKYALGCEAAAAVDWAAYFDVEIDETEFQSQLPESDNPDLGFVGDVTGRWGQIPPRDYGVHADPVADLLYFEYDLPVYAYRDFTLEEIKMSISQDRPVIAWVIGNVTAGQPVEYEDEEGNTTIVAAFEHVVIVTGYDDTTSRIRYMNNGRSYETSEQAFLASWAVLENMVIVYEE